MARVARLGVVIDSSGAKRGADETNRALNGMSSTALRAQRAIVQAMSAIGAAMGIREVVQLADSWTRLEGRLKTVTSSAAELASVQRQLVNVANATRTGIEETISLYTRLARSAGELGMSQSDVVRLTDLTAKTLVVSGTSATQASGALLQFSQALGGGVVRAEEFNSILEGTPVIVQEVAKSMGLTVAELRRLVIAGEVTSQQFAEAFLDATGRINDSFSKLGPTVEGALTQLSNAFAEAIGRGNAAGGATQELAAAIIELAAMIRENQATFDAMGEALATMLRWGTAAADAFIKAGDAVDRLGDYIAGAAKATEGLANFDTTAWTEGITMMTKANADYEESVRRVGRALSTTRREAAGMSSEGAAFMRNLTGGGMGGSLAPTPFGMMGGLGGGGAAASRAQLALGAQVERALEAQSKAQRDAAKAIEERKQIEADYQAQVVQLGIELADRARTAEEERTAALRDGATATAGFLATGQKRLSTLQAEVAALAQGAVATIEFTRQQTLNALVTERLNDAKAAGVALTPQVLGAIIGEAAETQRLLEKREALAKWDGKSPFTLPTENVDQFSSRVNDVLGTARELAQVFGNVGTQITRAVQLAANLVGAFQSATQAAAQLAKVQSDPSSSPGQIANAKRASTGANIAAGASFLTASISVITAWSSAVRRSGEEAERLAVALREQRLAAKQSADAFVSQGGTGLQREIGTITASFNDVIRGLLAAGAPTVPRLGARTARSVVPTADDVNRVIDRYEELIAKAKEAAAFQLAQAEGDLQARMLAAQGRTAEADAIRLQMAQAKELRDAEAEFGANSPYVAHLRTVQAAETAAAQAAETRRQAQQAFDRQQFGLDLTQRRQTLNGDTRGAFITGQTIANNAALAQAQDLVAAGTITAEMFEALNVLLGDELVAALKAFDEAAAEAKVQTMEDLEVRALVAQGRTAEAEQRRIEIANRRELLGVTDEATRAEILRVQAIEEAGRIAAAAAEAERVRQEQNADIDRRMIDVYKILDPAKAKELEQRQKEIDRTNELKNAADDATRARLQELYAMEDAAEAAVKLADAQREQARIAEELASFTQSLNVQYLRSQGRGFDADVAELNEWRTEQRKRASAIGAGPDAFAQIDAIYASRYNDLVKRSMGMNDPIQTPELTPSAAEGSTVLGEDTIAVRSARSITESTALQLVDYSASQLAVQREILSEIRGRRESSGGLLASPSLDLMERQLGQRANTAAMLLGGSVR